MHKCMQVCAHTRVFSRVQKQALIYISPYSAPRRERNFMYYSKQLVRATLVQIETVSFAASVADLFSKDPSVHALRNNLCPYTMSCCSSPRFK